MSWKENVEELRESLLHREKSEEKRQAREERPEKDLHRIDEATGSECLDD